MENQGNTSENLLTQNVSSAKISEGELFEFDIIGMSCTSCAKSIKTYLEKLKGISSVDINYASESGSVIYDPVLIKRD